MRQKYFLTPFGLAGDQTTIPNALDPSGQVSFNQGWGVDYQRDQSTDPLAKPIDRGTMNYLFFVATQAIKQYQENGAPEFISTADNGGSPFPYMTGNVVRFSSDNGATVPFAPYVSLVDNNTDAPNTPSTTKWQPLVFQIASQAEMQAMTANNRLVTPANIAYAIAKYLQSNPVSAFQSGQFVQFAGAAPPVGTLAANGAAVSRTTYAKLFAAIGTTYGPGDGSTTFNLPNVAAGQVLRASGTGFTLAANDNGAVISHTHTATTANSPSHTHSGSSVSTVADHQHTGTTGTVSNDHTHGFTTGGQSTGHVHTGTTDGVGNHNHTMSGKGGTFSGASGAVNIYGMSPQVTVTGQTGDAGAHSHTFTTGGNNVDHSHSGNTGGISANHTHAFTSNGAGGHTHTPTIVADGIHTHTVSVTNTGGTANTAAGINVLHCIAY